MDSKTENFREKKRQQRREAILDAVVLLVGRGSVLTLDAIAEATGVSRVTLYQYFSGKQELLEAAVGERGIEIEGLDLPGVEERILQAARRVFSQRGLRMATMEEVAQEAGVGTATLYRRFGDKAGLIQAFAENIRPQQALSALELSVERGLEESLAAFAGEALKYLSRNADLLQLMLGEAGEMPDSLEVFRQRPGRTSARLATFFKEHQKRGNIVGLEPKRLATSFLGMMFSHGVLAPILEGVPLTEPEAVGALVARIFVRGVASSD